MTNSPYAALKIADFRLFLVSRLLVSLALQIQGLAVGWQLYALTKDPLVLGLIGLTEALPAMSVALYAGHVADTAQRRSIGLWCVVAFAVSCFSQGLASFGLITVHTLVIILFAMIALSGIGRGFYAPAVFGILSDIVPRELYGNAVAWTSTLFRGSAIAGPVVGGLFYATYGAQAAYFASAALLVGAFLSFFCLKTRTSLESKSDAGFVAQVTEGLKFVASNQIMLGAMILDLFGVLFGGAVALLPIFVSEVFHLGPHALGLLRAAPSIGALFALVILTRKPIVRHTGAVFMAVVAGFGLCMIAFGLSTNFYLSIFLLAASGALDAISVWVRTTIYQLLTPIEMKGRVGAVNQICLLSSNEIGEFESGVTAKFMGLVPSVVFGGCMTILVVMITMFKAPKLRKLHMHSLYKRT